MSKKTIKHAVKVMKEIVAGVRPDVIKNYEMLTLCNVETARETGIVVILTLSTRYDYTSEILEDWRERLDAADYTIRMNRNRLQVRFDIMF